MATTREEVAVRENGTETLAALEESEAKALAALEAVEEVNSPEEAEALLRKITAYQQAVRLAKIGHDQERRWASVRLHAERKMGELLGPAENHGPATVAACDGSPEDRDVRARARKVYDVPEETFTAYLEAAEEPTRAGLLRAAKEVESSGAPDPEPADPPGTRKVSAQKKIVRGIAGQSQLIIELAPHLDFDAIKALPEGETQEWKQQLSSARTILSRVIGSL